MPTRDVNRIPTAKRVLRESEGALAKEIADAVHEQVDENWRSGMDATGTPWTPNAPSTIRSKGGSTPLIDTEQMRDDYAVSTDGDTARFGPASDRAAKLTAIHEHGVAEQGIPPRPIIRPAHEYAGDIAGDVGERSLKRALDGVTL